MAGGYKYVPQGIAALVAEFRAMKNDIRILRKMITGFGLTVDPQGNLIFDATGKNVIIKNGSGLDIQDDGNANVDGSLTVGGTETVGGTLHVTGNTIIGGTLSLPNGIIDNAALSAPVYPKTGHADATNFGLTLTPTEKARVTITVPAGFTQALVFAATNINARNTSAGQDALQGYVDINGANSGWDSRNDAAPGYTTGISNSAAILLTSLGSSFYVRGMAETTIASSWSADPFNSINVDAMVLFLR